MPQSHGTFTIAAPPDKVPEIARTAIGRAGWRVDIINTEFCELSANDERTDRIKGQNWRYSYRLVMQWEEVEGGTRIEASVEERNYQWTIQNCSKRLKEIADIMKEQSKRYQKLKAKERPRTKYGSARWGTLEDIKKAGYWGGIPDYNPDGRLLLSPGDDDEIVAVSEDDTIKHAMVVGPTGTGKSSSIFIPNLVARCNKSALVTEARAGNDKPDLYWKTANFRAIMGGQQIYHFDPDDLTSHRVNPLDGVKSYTDANNLAWLIVENTTGKNNYGDDVWPKSEANMLTTLIAHAAALDLHLGYIRALLREGPEGMEKTLYESPVEVVREDYRGFMNTSREGFRYGVIASLITRLGIWSSPKVIALTEKTDFDINLLPKQKFTFYLSVPANKKQLKPIAALVFNYLLNFIQESHFDDPPFLLLDEFTNFGRIPGINDKLSIIRHQKISFMLGFQDFAQLDGIYDHTVSKDLKKQPRTRIFFRPADYEPAEAISRMAGKTTIYERTVSSSGQIQEREMGRWLIDPSEVMTMPEDEIIVFTPSAPPLKLPKYSWKAFSQATAYPPQQRKEIVIDDQAIQQCRETRRKAEWQKKWDQMKKEEEESKPKSQPKSKSKQSRNRTEETKPKPKPNKPRKPKGKKTANDGTPEQRQERKKEKHWYERQQTNKKKRDEKDEPQMGAPDVDF